MESPCKCDIERQGSISHGVSYTLQQRAVNSIVITQRAIEVVSQASCRMDVTRLEQRTYSGLWTFWGITLKLYEYENGIFLNYLYVS